MPVPYVKKWTKVKQETNAATKKVTVHCAKNDVLVIDDDHEVVVIDADNDGSDLPAGADDNRGDLPAWQGCKRCETYPEAGTCYWCKTVYH